MVKIVSYFSDMMLVYLFTGNIWAVKDIVWFRAHRNQKGLKEQARIYTLGVIITGILSIMVSHHYILCKRTGNFTMSLDRMQHSEAFNSPSTNYKNDTDIKTCDGGG